MGQSLATGSAESSLEFWNYEAPPTSLDLVQNNRVSNALRLALHGLSRFYLHACHHYHAEGVENLRGSRPVLVAANHSSHLDVAALFAAFPLTAVNRVRALAAKDYFFTNAFMRTVGFFVANAVPLGRQRIEASLISFCRKSVAEGVSLVVFPEGTRSGDGRLQPFRPGVGMLAKKLDVHVVPAYLDGTHQCLPKGTLVPRWRPIQVGFGEPIDFGSVEDSREGWIAIADQIHDRIREMSACGTKTVGCIQGGEQRER